MSYLFVDAPAHVPLRDSACSQISVSSFIFMALRARQLLQDCFECTDWDMFREAATNSDSINLEEYTSTVTRVLRECAEQLADVFTDIFNISLSSNVVPTCLKTTTIVPVPKKSTVSCLNDYCSVTLTPIVIKCFKRLVMRHTKTQLPPSLDPMQFAYHPNRFTDDAIFTTLHLALTHLDNKDSYVRMLFIDFSSAFNTIIPQHLIEKLSLLGLNTSFCNWILDFLTGRPQSVRIGNSIFSTTTLSTKASQGCVLSPLLFTLLTHNCVAMHSSNHIVKFDDDTTVVGLISKNDESAYKEEMQRLTAWCGANNLTLNVDKTKEMVVDFRRAQSDQSPLIIDKCSVEIVKSTKFLGVHLAENLTWSLNTSSITKKAQQRLYFLRMLRKTHLPPQILTMFYRGTIESILSSCITADGNLPKMNPLESLHYAPSFLRAITLEVGAVLKFLKAFKVTQAASAPDTQPNDSTSLMDPCEVCSEWNLCTVTTLIVTDLLLASSIFVESNLSNYHSQILKESIL
ncbi:gastrula zinc finger protein XlCGF28.1-like [Silurus asotus]|uniref:Gastrula zinc finger protein XlCGF28.1-like n=1 Tax=Silurus asotus TaxID=30991 RepID=A0AAD5A980_SILAS|nr:gastrula zinc finger protein XlCGF28.1-like [Silurus asotus]